MEHYFSTVTILKVMSPDCLQIFSLFACTIGVNPPSYRLLLQSLPEPQGVKLSFPGPKWVFSNGHNFLSTNSNSIFYEWLPQSFSRPSRYECIREKPSFARSDKPASPAGAPIGADSFKFNSFKILFDWCRFAEALQNLRSLVLDTSRFFFE